MQNVWCIAQIWWKNNILSYLDNTRETIVYPTLCNSAVNQIYKERAQQPQHSDQIWKQLKLACFRFSSSAADLVEVTRKSQTPKEIRDAGFVLTHVTEHSSLNIYITLTSYSFTF